MEPGGESLWRKAGLKMNQANLFAALTVAFPAQLDSAAVETDHGLVYSWRDLDRASAMMASWAARCGLLPPPSHRLTVAKETPRRSASWSWVRLRAARMARMVAGRGLFSELMLL